MSESPTAPLLTTDPEHGYQDDVGLLASPRHSPSDEVQAGSSMGRLVAVDVMRGLTIGLMIFVNNADEDRPWWLGHAKWNGLHLADLVMPWFLAIVGTSVALALTRQRSRGAGRGALLGKVLLRTAKLLALGLLLQGGAHTWRFPAWDLTQLRYCGVLQRIGVVYLVTSLLVLFVPRFSSEAQLQLEEGTWKHAMLAVPLVHLYWWALGAAMLLTYGCIAQFLRVPGCPTRPPFAPDCNVAGYLDNLALGPKHMFPWPSCLHTVPPCTAFDPEGLFTTAGAIVTGFIGVYYGMVFLTLRSHKARCAELARTSLLLLAATAAAVKLAHIPVNKDLYTVSYITATGGTAGLLLLGSYLLLGIWEVPAFGVLTKPFLWLGMNSIAVYAGDDLLQEATNWVYWGDPSSSLKAWIVDVLTDMVRLQWVGKAIYAGMHLVLWVFVARWLHHQKLFFKI